jgi:hypothetical protein
MSSLADFRLSRRQRTLVRALIPVVCPPDWEKFGVVDAVVNEVELGLRAMPRAVRLALASGMLAYDVGAAVFPRHPGRPARKLAGHAAAAYLRFWAHGTALQRNFVKGIKGLIAMAYYEQPAVLEAIGYRPQQWIDEVKTRRLAVYADDISKHEGSLFEPDPIPLPSDVGRRVVGTVHLAAKSADPSTGKKEAL